MSGLFERLRDAAASDWQDYTRHAFVEQMIDGSLPEAAFRHYLIQDYIFLVHFSRAYALAAFKAEDIGEIRDCLAIATAIVNEEMQLHIRLCAEWGLSEDDLAKADEDNACMAYTRYVLERGLSGDALDLMVALAPCMLGYWDIGQYAANAPHLKREDNPYCVWIDEYASEGYGEVAEKAMARLDKLAARTMTEARFESLVKTFAQATRLESAFWQMGLDAVTGKA